MRSLALLALYVSLGWAGDWNTNSKDGMAAAIRQDYRAAAAAFKETLALAGTPEQHAIAASNLAIVYRFTGDYVSAERLARSALNDARCDGEIRTTLLNTLADILREEGHDLEAHAYFDEALRVPGIPWSERMEALAGIANIERAPVQWQKIVQLARDHGDQSQEAAGLRGMAETWLELHHSERAEPILRQALAVLARSPDDADHPMAATLSVLGEMYLSDDKAAMAEDALTRALTIDERILGGDHPQVALLLEMLGDAAARLNRMEQSRRDFERARLIVSSRFGEKSPVIAAVYINRGNVEQRSHHQAEAIEAYRKALSVLDQTDPEMSPLRVSVMQQYARVLKATHHGQEAKALLAQVRTFTKSEMPQSQ